MEMDLMFSYTTVFLTQAENNFTAYILPLKHLFLKCNSNLQIQKTQHRNYLQINFICLLHPDH